jgi:nicotinate-nucleotide adenylyltransferase
VTTALLGGVFDPPHLGHVELARAARDRFRPDGLVVLVAAAPGHKEVVADAEVRLRLARAAFPDLRVDLDGHARTVDLLRERRYDDPLFLVGADELAGFLDWKEPDDVLELARLGVATRPGYPRERLDPVLGRLRRPERVELFDVDPHPISSRDVRARVARGEPIDGLVPPEVAELIRKLGLYLRVPGRGYTVTERKDSTRL